jgi:two-component sensor histidine kinase
MLDVRTLFVSAAVLNLVMGAVLLLLWYTYRSRFSGIGFWVVGIIVILIGNILLSLQGIVNPLLSVVSGNALFALGFVLLFHGILLFEGIDRKRLLLALYLLPLFLFAEQMVFYYIVDSLMVRIIAVSFVTFFIQVFMLRFMVAGKKDWPPGRILMVVSIGVIAAFFLVRIPLTIFTLQASTLLEAGFVHILTVVVWMIMITGFCVGFSLLISHKLEDEERSRVMERDQLIREVHHRVKNNLLIIRNLLSLQAGMTESTEISQVLQESENRVSAIAMIHELLHSNDEAAQVQLHDYLADVAYHVYESYNIPGVSLKIEIPPIAVDSAVAVPCGIIVNELVTNASKYAFTDLDGGELYLKLHEQQGQIELICGDTGKGLPEDFNPEKGSSLGLKLVISLVQQLKGRLDIRSENGAEFTIRFQI